MWKGNKQVESSIWCFHSWSWVTEISDCLFLCSIPARNLQPNWDMMRALWDFFCPSWKSLSCHLCAQEKGYCAFSHQALYVFAVFCRTQLVSLDWHHMWSCNIQLHSGRPSLSTGSVQKTLECEALPGGFEGAIPYGRKVWKAFQPFWGGRPSSWE